MAEMREKIAEMREEIERLHCAADKFSLSKDIPKGSRLVLYGAGNKGRSVYHWLKRKQEYILAGIVDARYEKLRTDDFDVKAREEIFNTDYDYILVAVKNEKTEEAILDWLENNGVEKSKIIVSRITL